MAQVPLIWIVCDDWEALERYESELRRRLPGLDFEEIPFGATALENLRGVAVLPAALVVDLTSEDMTPEEFRAAWHALPTERRRPLIEVGFGELRRPFRYEALADALRARLAGESRDIKPLS
jgi:hypothetical protein